MIVGAGRSHDRRRNRPRFPLVGMYARPIAFLTSSGGRSRQSIAAGRDEFKIARPPILVARDPGRIPAGARGAPPRASPREGALAAGGQRWSVAGTRGEAVALPTMK